MFFLKISIFYLDLNFIQLIKSFFIITFYSFNSTFTIFLIIKSFIIIIWSFFANIFIFIQILSGNYKYCFLITEI